MRSFRRPQVSCEPLINVTNITVEMVEDRLMMLDIGKSRGPDGIPPVFLKKCASTLSEPLAFLYNKSLSSGLFPNEWKITNVTPILKKGPTMDVSNYRPIAKLNSLAKVFESLVTDDLFGKTKHLIVPEQHGFFKKRSTATNLVGFTEFVQSAVDRKTQVDVIFTDLEKAFDRVNHKLLVYKLQSLGIDTVFITWLYSYLTNRKLRVVLDGSVSDVYFAPSGVPQGSHLGPLLFILFINDIYLSVHHSKFLLYADDFKIYKEIHTVEDSDKLQSDISTVSQYFSTNLLSLNLSKCNCLRFTRNTVNRFDIFYHINDHYLEVVDKIRDLGILFDSELTFRPHAEKIANSAYRMLGFVLRTANRFRKVKTILILYNSLVRSLLEYCVAVWDPFYESHINIIERIQRRFCMYIYFKRLLPDPPLHYSYSWTLTNLGIQPLFRRRLYLQMIFLYKSIRGIFDSSSYFRSFVFFNTSSRTRNTNTFYYNSSRSNIGLNTPINRLMRLYNQYFDRAPLVTGGFSYFKRYVSEIVESL